MNVAHMPLPHGASDNGPTHIVVHAMAEYIDTAERDYHAVEWLDKLGLSAHALVTPSGVVIRCRDDDQGAYHAKGHNTDTLGIEILVPGLHTYATFARTLETPWLGIHTPQWHASIDVCRDWYEKFMKDEELPFDAAIVRHSDLDPGRKMDPGAGFPWPEFVEAVRG